MKKTHIWIVAGAAVLLIGASALYLNQSGPKVSPKTSSEAETMLEKKDEAMMKDGAMLEPVKDKTMEADQTPANDLWAGPGSYQTYTSELVSREQAAGRTVVLFFHAPWCPYCKTADANFTANVSKIPHGVTVLKTDYDSNVDLKKQYGVTYQHTFVQIDNNGQLVSKWAGGDIDNLIKYLK
jgi:thioredoxin 1